MKAYLFKIPKNDEGSIKLQEDKQQYFYTYLHYHPEIQITLILKGEGEFIIGGKRGAFSSGNIFLIGANDPHVFLSDKYEIEDQKMTSHSISLFFNKSTFGKDFFQLSELRSLGFFIDEFSKGLKIESTTKEIKSTFKKLFSALDLMKFQLFIQLLGQLKSVDNKIILNPSAELIKPSRTDDQKLSDVYAYILDHFKDNANLKEAAHKANMSIPSFCRYIKRRTQKTFTALVNDLRIAEAQKLLVKSDKSISEIAYDVGFNNISNFNRKFKTITGKTPGEYKIR